MTALMMRRGVCVYRMNGNTIFDGREIILEQIVRLTSLSKFVHDGAGGLDGYEKVRKGYLFILRKTHLNTLVRLIFPLFLDVFQSEIYDSHRTDADSSDQIILKLIKITF